MSELQETAKDREAWRATVHEVAEWDMTEQLNNEGRLPEELSLKLSDWSPFPGSEPAGVRRDVTDSPGRPAAAFHTHLHHVHLQFYAAVFHRLCVSVHSHRFCMGGLMCTRTMTAPTLVSKCTPEFTLERV